jgi:hypothetical protein
MSNHNPGQLPSRQGIWSPPLSQQNTARVYEIILSKYLTWKKELENRI